MADSLLIIEDERMLRQELARHFREQGWEVESAGDLRGARAKLSDPGYEPLVTLADTSLPDGNALDLLEELQQQGPSGEWVLLSGGGGVPESVRALRLGAYDFLEKPCTPKRLGPVLNGARRSARAQRQLRDQTEAEGGRYTPEAFLGRSEAARDLRALLARLVEVPFSGLVVGGETGTGKGLVARILHHYGPRANAPMIEVNCAALPRGLLESELFGHEAGAFTGARGRHRGYLEQAHGGTLFLDEIGDMDQDLQAKLLTVIEDRVLRRLGGDKPIQVDVQVVAASNRDLEQLVDEGTFRRDLYHRLSVFQLDLPPLRERLEDLEDLVPLMVAEFNAAADRHVKVIPESVYRSMRAYHWPGNVRELRNAVERAVLLSEGDLFPERWLQLDSGPGRLSNPSPGRPRVERDSLILPLDGSMALDEMDGQIIQTALEKHGFNIAATARTLGTTRETLRYRIQKYRLRHQPPPAFRPATAS